MNAPQSWGARVDAYLSYRRSLGFSLEAESYYLPQFARFAEAQHAPRLTAQLAIDWACTSKRQTPITRAFRILRLRGFAKYCQKFDPDGEIPPLGVFGRTRRRLVPHIYTDQEIAEILEATSTLRALRAYGQQRDSNVVRPHSDHFFLLDNGKPPTRARICCGLQRLVSELGWKPRGDYLHHRVQDVRHTFIVRSILRAFEEGLNVDQVVLTLSRYVGHDHVADTYWYVTGIPELMAIAAERFHDYSKVLP